MVDRDIQRGDWREPIGAALERYAALQCFSSARIQPDFISTSEFLPSLLHAHRRLPGPCLLYQSLSVTVCTEETRFRFPDPTRGAESVSWLSSS